MDIPLIKFPNIYTYIIRIIVSSNQNQEDKSSLLPLNALVKPNKWNDKSIKF